MGDGWKSKPALMRQADPDWRIEGMEIVIHVTTRDGYHNHQRVRCCEVMTGELCDPAKCAALFGLTVSDLKALTIFYAEQDDDEA